MISIVVCTYNRANILIKCINSIIESNKVDENIELLIIDNNSNDNTEKIINEYLRKYKYIRYYKEENVGLSYARNRGIIEARGEYIVFLDDDVIIDKEYINNLYSFLQSNKNVICIAGKVVPIWSMNKPAWFTDQFHSIIAETRYGDKVRILKEREYPVGCNMIFAKSAFNEVGYFNTELGIKGDKLFLGEEVDICDKIKKKGYMIYYSPHLVCNHKVHENKVNKDYIENRLMLEGVSVAQTHIETKRTIALIVSLIKRNCILIIRDIPMLIISSTLKLNNSFEKHCKYIRSREYIKKVVNYLKDK